MKKDAHAFFPASRREDPDWLNPRSLTAGPDDPAIKRFNDRLAKPLRVETCTEENISWILNVFLDSLVDFRLLRPNLSPEDSRLIYRNRQVLQGALTECRTHIANGTSRWYRRVTSELSWSVHQSRLAIQVEAMGR